MVNQSKSRAWLVLRAAIRMKVLMEAKRKRDEEEREAAVEAAEAGDSHTPLLGGSPGSQYTHMTAHSFSRVSIAESIAKTVDHQVKWWLHDLATIQEILMSSWVNLLLVCIPLGFCAGFWKWDAIAVFTLNFLSLIPLALVLGDVTEDLALRYGSTVGGLINATFGNVVEVILSLSALNKGLYQVVATSLLGSILSNLLLVTGCSFFFGGLLYRNQTFNKAGNQVCSSLLFLAALGFLFPTAASTMVSDPDAAADWTLHLSRYTAIILLIMYACYLVMQLHTHKDLFADEDDDDAEPMLSLVASLGMLVLITACVTVHSEFLTGTIEAFSKQSGVNTLFLSMIVLPIAGNACEHMTAVLVAMKNKMDLSMGVAVGSSIQIALFALPLTVIVGWAIGRPMSLNFDQFSALALTVAVVQSHFVTSGGRSHWMMGVQLIALYSLIAVAFLER